MTMPLSHIEITKPRINTYSIESTVEGAPDLIVDGRAYPVLPRRIEVRYARDEAGTWKVDRASVSGEDHDPENLYVVGVGLELYTVHIATAEQIMALDGLPDWALHFIASHIPQH
jgi:hypothetical protein